MAPLQGHKIAKAGAAVLIAEPVLALAHTGAVGIIVGLAVGAAVYSSIDDIDSGIDKVRSSLSLPAPQPSAPGQHSLAYRLVNGKSTRGNEQAQPMAEERPATSARATLPLGTRRDGRRFDPPMKRVIGRGLLLAGSQGTGKSNIIGDIVYKAAKLYTMPVVLIDYKNEFYPLTDVLDSAIRAGHPSAREEIGAGFFPLTAESGADLAEIVMEGPFQVIVDLPSYSANMDEGAQAIATLLHGLVTWGKDMRRKGDEPWPCLVITDEAHNLVPQQNALSALPMKKESFDALKSAYSSAANAGRSYGLTMVMATQRLPNIAKWAIANLQGKVILAHAEKNDLDACEEETNHEVDRETIKALPVGSGIVVGIEAEPVTVTFDRQKARHVSTTPGVERLQQQFAGRPRPRLSRVLARRVPGTDRYERVDAAPTSLATSAPTSSTSERGSGLEAAEKRAEAAGSGNGHNGLSEREMAVLTLLEAGASDSQIIKELWHAEGGGSFQKAAIELQAIILKLVRR